MYHFFFFFALMPLMGALQNLNSWNFVIGFTNHFSGTKAFLSFFFLFVFLKFGIVNDCCDIYGFLLHALFGACGDKLSKIFFFHVWGLFAYISMAINTSTCKNFIHVVLLLAFDSQRHFVDQNAFSVRNRRTLFLLCFEWFMLDLTYLLLYIHKPLRHVPEFVMRMLPIDNRWKWFLVQIHEVFPIILTRHWRFLITHLTLVLQLTFFQLAISKHTILEGSCEHSSTLSGANCPWTYAFKFERNFLSFLVLDWDELYFDFFGIWWIRALCIVILFPWRMLFVNVSDTGSTHCFKARSSPTARFVVGNCLALLLIICKGINVSVLK